MLAAFDKCIAFNYYALLPKYRFRRHFSHKFSSTSFDKDLYRTLSYATPVYYSPHIHSTCRWSGNYDAHSKSTVGNYDLTPCLRPSKVGEEGPREPRLSSSLMADKRAYNFSGKVGRLQEPCEFPESANILSSTSVYINEEFSKPTISICNQEDKENAGTFQNGLSDPDFRYRPRQVDERRGKRYKGGTDAMREVLDRFSTSAGEVKTDPCCTTGAGEPVEEDQIGWKSILEKSQPKRRGG
ncbi:hypothetical protein GEV33_012185 [Tenebrio molitor]|uniref:Uncharacterized protein n=1 Tax=Tenebrio molitor TaxID=7067 RepID=A0A8J6LFD1_TENMO|nr:hypothetical protein GEV33_012185 [Tenebrio molitor]